MQKGSGYKYITGIAAAFKEFTQTDISPEIMDSIKSSETSQKVIATFSPWPYKRRRVSATCSPAGCCP